MRATGAGVRLIRAHVLLVIGLAAALLLPLVSRVRLPQPLQWIVDLAVHWQWLYAALFAIACLAGAFWQRRWLLLLPLCALPVLTASPRLPRAADDPPALRIAFANVHVSNRDPAPLLAWLAHEPVDLLAIAELSPAYAAALEAGTPDELQHRSLYPLSTPWGLGLLSKHPLRDIRLIHAPDGVARLQASVEIDGRQVQLTVTHPKPPVTAQLQAARDALMETVVRSMPSGPSIVVGDINATPWSRPLLQAASQGLKRATGLEPTWPAWWRLRPGIPIDHVLGSTHWSVGKTAHGPGTGSDHRPVRAELHWRHKP